MAEFPETLRYANSHEWAQLMEDGSVRVGISDHAQDALGDVVYVELPEIGLVVNAMDEIAVVESVKAASEVFAPVSGEVVEVNQSLEDSPETVNEAPYAGGWFLRLEPSDVQELDNLMDAGAYQQHCAQDEH